jgi:hypothetical protein
MRRKCQRRMACLECFIPRVICYSMSAWMKMALLEYVLEHWAMDDDYL